MRHTVKAWAVVGSSIASYRLSTGGPLAIYRRKHHAPTWRDLQVVRCTVTYETGKPKRAGRKHDVR